MGSDTVRELVLVHLNKHQLMNSLGIHSSERIGRQRKKGPATELELGPTLYRRAPATEFKRVIGDEGSQLESVARMAETLR